MIPRDEWKWFGNAGHFIGADRCQFHLTTQVGRFVVSTVGQWMDIDPERTFRKLDGHLFETMVFRAGTPCSCGCGYPVPTDGDELAVQSYDSAREANRGHLELCERFANEAQP